MFNSPLLDTTAAIPCGTNEYCYKNGKTYACNAGSVLESSIRECVLINNINSYSLNRLLVPGINALNNQKGTLTDICYGTTSMRDPNNL
jgi:hypothetical protein